MIRDNPFLWDPSANNVTSPVVSAGIDDCSAAVSALLRKKRDTTSIPVTSGGFEVTIRTASNFGQYINLNTSDQYGMIFHYYNLSSPGHIPLLIRVTSAMPVNDTNGTLIVYLRGNLPPTPVEYDWIMMQSSNDSNSLMLYLQPSEIFNVSVLYVGVQTIAGILLV